MMIRLIKVCLVMAVVMLTTIGFSSQALAQDEPMAAPANMEMAMGMKTMMSDTSMPLMMKHPVGWCSDFCFIEGVRNMDAIFNFSGNPELAPVFQELVNKSLRSILVRYIGQEEEYALLPDSVKASLKRLEEAGYTIQ